MNGVSGTSKQNRGASSLPGYKVTRIDLLTNGPLRNLREAVQRCNIYKCRPSEGGRLFGSISPQKLNCCWLRKIVHQILFLHSRTLEHFCLALDVTGSNVNCNERVKTLESLGSFLKSSFEATRLRDSHICSYGANGQENTLVTPTWSEWSPMRILDAVLRALNFVYALKRSF